MEHDLTKITPDIRYLNDIKSVVYDKNWLKTAENFELYYMYRGLEEKNNLRYDITIIPAKMLGNEFVKTKGHYHEGKFGEVYMVLEGTAIYLMSAYGRSPEGRQKDDEITDVYFVEAKKGDVIIIPPFYGHVTINPSETENLKMANWVCKDCKSDYSLYEKMGGACYFYLKGGWLKNENYKSLPELRKEQPIKSLPEDLNFLS